MKVYFDNAATTPMRKEVIESISSVMEECYGNPSSSHAFGRTAKTYIETARKAIANLLNAMPQEIIFTSGGTESDNMILNCAVKDLKVTTLISSSLPGSAQYIRSSGMLNLQFSEIGLHTVTVEVRDTYDVNTYNITVDVYDSVPFTISKTDTEYL